MWPFRKKANVELDQYFQIAFVDIDGNQYWVDTKFDCRKSCLKHAFLEKEVLEKVIKNKVQYCVLRHFQLILGYWKMASSERGSLMKLSGGSW